MSKDFLLEIRQVMQEYQFAEEGQKKWNGIITRKNRIDPMWPANDSPLKIEN
jgi:hypothetical protein